MCAQQNCHTSLCLVLYGEEKDGEDYHLDDNNTKVYVNTYKYFQ